MAVTTAVCSSYPPTRRRQLQPILTVLSRQSAPRVFISTKPSDVNPLLLRDLYTLCNHSCNRFPNVDAEGRVEPVDVAKLRVALSHSSVVVSVFANNQLASSSELLNSTATGKDWVPKLMPVTPENGQLVGFGRAVSDLGLTAAIYDVM